MNGCMSAFGGMPPAELSKGLKQLKGEHPALLAQLDNIFQLTEQITHGFDVKEKFYLLKAKVIEFKDSLDPHSEREEGVLFPMMGAYIGTTSGPIAAMEYEHDQAKSYIKEFIDKAEEKPLSEEEIKIGLDLIKKAYFILTEHFAKEENVLFPMAERMLSDEEKAALYNKIRIQQIG